VSLSRLRFTSEGRDLEVRRLVRDFGEGEVESGHRGLETGSEVSVGGKGRKEKYFYTFHAPETKQVELVLDVTFRLGGQGSKGERTGEFVFSPRAGSRLPKDGSRKMSYTHSGGGGGTPTDLCVPAHGGCLTRPNLRGRLQSIGDRPREEKNKRHRFRGKLEKRLVGENTGSRGPSRTNSLCSLGGFKNTAYWSTGNDN